MFSDDDTQQSPGPPSQDGGGSNDAPQAPPPTDSAPLERPDDIVTDLREGDYGDLERRA